MSRLLPLASTFMLLELAVGSFAAEAPDGPELDRLWLEVENGKNLMESGELEYARDVLNDALKGLEKRYGKKSAELVPAMALLAGTSAKLGDTRQQIVLYKRAVDLTRKEYGAESAQFADISYEAGYSLTRNARNSDEIRLGLTMLSEALDAYINLFSSYEPGSSDPMSADTAMALGEILLRGEEYTAARHVFSSALDQLGKDRFALNEDRVRAHAGLASAYVLDGKPELASEDCRAIRHSTYAARSESENAGRADLEAPEFQPVAPIYPWNLVLTRVEGYVDFAFSVDAMGFVQTPSLLAVEGHKDFVPAAVRALCTFRYEPARQGGEPQTVDEKNVRISFKVD